MRTTLVSLLFCLVFSATVHASLTDATLVSELRTHAASIDPKVLQLALKANSCAVKRGIASGKNVLTIVDFSLPSTQKRLWTFDLASHRLLFNDYVAHGKTSGDNRTVHFSNDEGSLASSLGVYLTANPYIGKNGYSLRLKGLEKGFNDNVYSRAVVLHGAWYVSEEMIRTFGRLGRSYGCPAVRKEIATPLINTVKDGSLLFAYYPDEQWLSHSAYLNCD